MCSGRTTSELTNIQVLFSDLMKEWDWERNNISPTKLRPGSDKKVFWKCLKNPKHLWETTVYSRTSSDIGCPYCSGKYTLKEDSLGVISQELMKEWDYKLNNGIDPFSLSTKSEKKVWWRCSEDDTHYWKTTISHRTKGTKCPYCSFTSLLVRRYVKNHKLELSDKIQLYYLMFFNQDEVFYKVGITKNSIEERYKTLYEKTGYKIVKVKIIEDTLQKIINLEQTLHRKVSRGLDVDLIKYRPKKYFGGISECYQLPEKLKLYENRVRKRYLQYNSIISLNKI
jgi:DNA-directed RNA polymerase subunit RPC12/RpoP